MKYINLIANKAYKFIRYICRWDSDNIYEAAFCTVCNIGTLCCFIFIWYMIHFVK